MFALKMTDSKDSSTAIMLPFEQKWEDQLRESRVTTVFRKKGPRQFKPTFLYVYMASPTSALIGRFKVNAFEFMRIDKAAKLAPAGGLTETQLRFYSGLKSELAVFQLGRFEPAKSPLPFRQLSDAYKFFPPQTFVRLSQSGKAELDRALGY